MALSDADKAILDYEGSWWKTPERKLEGIRAQLGITPTRYYRRLSELIDLDDAKDHAPLVVLRLRKKRSERRRDRFEGFAEPQNPRN